MSFHNSPKHLGLPWMLAGALNSLIFTIEGTIHARTNLLALIYSITSAIIQADGVKISDEEKETLDEIEGNISQLRETYEYIIDDKENLEVGTQKRTSYEMILDITQRQLMYIIHKYTLVDASLMQSETAIRWGDFKQ